MPSIFDKTSAPEGVERLPSGGIKYRGETFPGYNKPKAAPAGSDKKKRVLAKKGDKVKVVSFGQRGYKHNYSAKAKKSYLARSAGIKGKDDKFSANYWSRRVLWPSGQKADGSSKKTASQALVGLGAGAGLGSLATYYALRNQRDPELTARLLGEEDSVSRLRDSGQISEEDYGNWLRSRRDSGSLALPEHRYNFGKTASQALAIATPLVTGLGGAYIGDSIQEDYGKYLGAGTGILLGNYIANKYIDPDTHERQYRLGKAEEKGKKELARVIKQLDQEDSKKTASQALYRPRGTIFVTDGKGNVLAGKTEGKPKPGFEATSPYYFPGGGVLEEGATHTPSRREILDAVRKESLEELGFKINKLKILRDQGLRLDMPDWWVERNLRKRGIKYKGLDEYYVHAREGKQDKSIHGSEGDAFEGKYYPIKDVVKALHAHADKGGNDFGEANRLQAELLSKLSSYKRHRVEAMTYDPENENIKALQKRYGGKWKQELSRMYGGLPLDKMKPIKKDDHPTQRRQDELLSKLSSYKHSEDRVFTTGRAKNMDDAFSQIRTAMKSRFPDRDPADLEKLLTVLKGAAKTMLPKKDDHPTQRLKERTNLNPKIIGELRQAIKKNQDKIPEGDHHVELDDGSRAVIKEIRRRHVLATILASNMTRYPGQNLQYLNTKTAGFLSAAGKALRFGTNPGAQGAIGAASYGLGAKMDQNNPGSYTAKALKGIGAAGMALGGARLGKRGLSAANKALGKRMGSVADAAYPRMTGTSGGLRGKFRDTFNKFHSGVDKAGRGGAIHDGSRWGRRVGKATNWMATRVAGSPIRDTNARRALVGGSPVATMGTAAGGVSGSRTFIRGVSNLTAPLLNSRVGMLAGQAGSAYGAYNADSTLGKTLGAAGVTLFNPVSRRALLAGGRQFLANRGGAGRIGRAAKGTAQYGSYAKTTGSQVVNAVSNPNSTVGAVSRSAPKFVRSVTNAVFDPTSGGGMFVRGVRRGGRGLLAGGGLYGTYKAAQ